MKEKVLFMLREILSPKSCEKCRVCCVFDKDDIWEMPYVDDELMSYVKENINPEQKYIEKDNLRIFKPPNPDKDGIMSCAMLTDNGCCLKENKPLDCSVWPFRVMDFKGNLVITVSPVCGAVSGLPLSTITKFAEKGFGSMMLNKAKEGKLSVIDYIDKYPIIMTE